MPLPSGEVDRGRSGGTDVLDNQIQGRALRARP